MIQEDRNHLEWIYCRLVYEYKENPKADYMVKFKKNN